MTQTGTVQLSLKTFSGKLVDPLDVDPDFFNIEDIAHALAMTCRFGGHCRHFYSVAEHSVLVSTLVPGKFALTGLMHDAAEAYMGDIPRPLKRRLQGFKDAEDRLLTSMAAHFGFVFPFSPCVAQADEQMLETELLTLMNGGDACGHETTLNPIKCLPPQPAKQAFLERYNSLTNKNMEG